MHIIRIYYDCVLYEDVCSRVMWYYWIISLFWFLFLWILFENIFSTIWEITIDENMFFFCSFLWKVLHILLKYILHKICYGDMVDMWNSLSVLDVYNNILTGSNIFAHIRISLLWCFGSLLNIFQYWDYLRKVSLVMLHYGEVDF